MGWGALAGLGQGLQQFGSDISKSALQSKLENERAARQEQLEKAREERAAAREAEKPARTELFIGADGVLMKRTFNNTDKILNETLASKEDIMQTQRAEQQAKKDSLALAVAEKQLANYDEDRKWDMAYKKAQIQSLKDTSLARIISANASADRADGSGGGSSVDSQYADDPVGAVKEKYKDIVGEYQQGSAALSGAEVDAAIKRTRQLISESWAARGNPNMAKPSAGDIRSVLTQALEDIASKKRKAKGTSSDASDTGTSLILPMKK